MERSLRAKLVDGRFSRVTPQRSRMMSQVRGKGNRTTELRLRMLLVRHRMTGWRLHARDLAGRPDFFFPAARLAVFVDGCFWHGCPTCGHIPDRNRPFWKAKIARNRERDLGNNRQLAMLGIGVERVRECQLRHSGAAVISEIQRKLAPRYRTKYIKA